MAYTNSSLVSHTRISPNRTPNRNHAIDTISIHCVVGQCAVETLGSLFADPSREASSNYGVGYDGRIGMYVEEKDRSWCTSSRENDHRAITIEVASDTYHPYAVNDKAYNALIELLVDICKRNNIKELKWKADKSLIGQVDKQNMTVHRWFANKSCPGDYLYNRHYDIAEKVNAKLGVQTAQKKDGVYTKGVYTELSKNFESTEFDCHGSGCCTETVIDKQLVEYLQKIRDHFGKPITITSGYRCPVHNNRVGGATGSYHTKGMAADISVDGVKPREVAKYAETLGIKGIGLYETDNDGYFVHVDTRTSKSFWYGQSEKYMSTFNDTPNKENTQSDSNLNFKVGDIVNFTGDKHYASANATTGTPTKASKAKVTAVSKTGKHQYHVRAVNDNGSFISGVYGWVDADSISAIKSVATTTNKIDTVKEVQTWANTNYKSGLVVDGIYGYETKKALIKILQTEINQTYNAKLIIDGIWGSNTMTACPELENGDCNDVVSALQALLVCNGYSNAYVDGDYGTGTSNAVRAYQSKNGLVSDGIAGKNTFAKLCG